MVELGEDGFINRVVEKPQIPKSNMALVGIYLIRETSFLFNCLENNMRNQVMSRGEFSITDAIECMIEQGAKFLERSAACEISKTFIAMATVARPPPPPGRRPPVVSGPTRLRLPVQEAADAHSSGEAQQAG